MPSEIERRYVSTAYMKHRITKKSEVSGTFLLVILVISKLIKDNLGVYMFEGRNEQLLVERFR